MAGGKLIRERVVVELDSQSDIVHDSRDIKQFSVESLSRLKGSEPDCPKPGPDAVVEKRPRYILRRNLQRGTCRHRVRYNKVGHLHGPMLSSHLSSVTTCRPFAEVSYSPNLYRAIRDSISSTRPSGKTNKFVARNSSRVHHRTLDTARRSSAVHPETSTFECGASQR